jgi:hypothetical protein
MRTVGIAASVLFLLFVLLFLALFLRSIPDLARYRRLRRM